MLAKILAGHFPPQAENAGRLAIAVVFWVPGRLGQFFDHQVLWGVRWIAHPQIDHIVAGPPFFILQPIELGEQIGGQTPHPFRHFDGKGPAL